MSSNALGQRVDEVQISPAADLAAAISATDFSRCSATVVGYGYMGKEYVKALRALGTGRIRVCSRSAGPLEELGSVDGVETAAGGVERIKWQPERDELGIVATRTASLAEASHQLATLGYRHLLIEKPVCLQSHAIHRLGEIMENHNAEAVCAYNRLAYPSFQELRGRLGAEGGVTSCTYTFTELIKPDWPEIFSAEELARWGIANSLHVIGMAHGLIGLPASWHGHRSGGLSWHPTGAVFVGSGVSKQSIPFTYHADWGSTGRWSVEVHTPQSSYRLCPLEKLYRRGSAMDEWDELPVAAFDPELKAGIAEEVAAALSPDVRQLLPLVSIGQATALTEYAEAVFGYGAE